MCSFFKTASPSLAIRRCVDFKAQNSSASTLSGEFWKLNTHLLKWTKLEDTVLSHRIAIFFFLWTIVCFYAGQRWRGRRFLEGWNSPKWWHDQRDAELLQRSCSQFRNQSRITPSWTAALIFGQQQIAMTFIYIWDPWQEMGEQFLNSSFLALIQLSKLMNVCIPDRMILFVLYLLQKAASIRTIRLLHYFFFFPLLRFPILGQIPSDLTQHCDPLIQRTTVLHVDACGLKRQKESYIFKANLLIRTQRSASLG